MTWAALALALLKVVYSMLTFARERGLISAGYDKAVADQAMAVLGTTTEGKRILEKLNALTPTQLDDITDAVGNANKPKPS